MNPHRALKHSLALAALLTFAGTACAADTPDAAAPTTPSVDGVRLGSLTIGDPAPALQIAKWVKGEPISGFNPGTIYVVEFWATWCGPCIRSMPHLTKIQSQFANTRVIGVSTEDPRNTLEKVEKMTASKGDTMGYTVAWDDGPRTSNAYRVAAARMPIPSVFIVDGSGRIASIGGTADLEKTLTAIQAGTWDVAAAKAAFEANRDVDIAQTEFSLALRSKEPGKILSTGTALARFGERNPDLYNSVAWAIVDPGRGIDLRSEPRLVDLALEAATRAASGKGAEDAGALDTLARALFVKGDRAKAIETQQRAVAVAKSEKEKASLNETLAEYQAAK